MFLPRGPGGGAVEVRMGGDLNVQVEGGTAALKIQTKPLPKIYTRTAVQLALLYKVALVSKPNLCSNLYKNSCGSGRSCPNYPNHSFYKF
jgi:hypothetical protein